MTKKRPRWRPPRSDQAGVFAAAGGTAMTFQRTLMPRNTHRPSDRDGGNDEPDVPDRQPDARCYRGCCFP